MHRNISFFIFLVTAILMAVYFELSESINRWLGLDMDKPGPLGWFAIVVVSAGVLSIILWTLYEWGLLDFLKKKEEPKGNPPRYPK